MTIAGNILKYDEVEFNVQKQEQDGDPVLSVPQHLDYWFPQHTVENLMFNVLVIT